VNSALENWKQTNGFIKDRIRAGKQTYLQISNGISAGQNHINRYTHYWYHQNLLPWGA